MRNAFAEALYHEAVNDDRIYVVVADISPVGSMAKFREEFPDRFINVGVSEQSMIGIAAGLALKGKRPFCYTIATFALYRPFEFIRNDVCYQNLPVVIVGMGAGMSYPDHGATHHAIEDVAVASALPNMQVLAPCDPFETSQCVKWCARENQGPVYLRLGKSGEPVLDDRTPWVFGKPRLIRRGSSGTMFLTYGPIAELACEVASATDVDGYVYSVHTLKPFPEREVAETLKVANLTVTLEEHVEHGGLGEKVFVTRSMTGRSDRLSTFSLNDEFIHYNGDRNGMLARHGLTKEIILADLRR